jgi:hypothetical protein
MWNWTDDRWHLNGKPVHAGCGAEICWPDGTWEEVRLESANCGQNIYAHFSYHGLDLRVRVDCGGVNNDLHVRWPRLAGCRS